MVRGEDRGFDDWIRHVGVPFWDFGSGEATPLRGDESCSQTHERKGVKGDSVVHAGIAGEGKAKERKEIGINAENTEAGSTEGTERSE